MASSETENSERGVDKGYSNWIRASSDQMKII